MCTTTTERKSFGELSWPQTRTFQAGGRYKNPIKARKPYLPPKSLLCGPHSFRHRKVPHLSRAVYAFFFPVFALLRPEKLQLEMAEMLQNPVSSLPGCERISVNTLLCDPLGLALDGQNRLSQTASVQQTQSTLAGHSAIPRGTNVKRTNANRAIRIAAQRTQGLWGLISVFRREIWPPTNAGDSNRSDNSR